MKNKTMQLRLSENEMKQLEELAQEAGQSKSEWIRDAIKFAYKTMNK
jgi:predicted DNA-binding protein